MKKIIILAALIFTLNSCVEAVMVGSVSGVIVATREKSVKDTKDDVWIATQIDKNLLTHGMKTPRNSVEVMVNEGRVLLVGVVRDLEKGKQANKIVWQTSGVKELVDEIEIDEKGLRVRDFGGGFVDAFVTSKIKSKLFFSRKVTAADFKIKTENGVVYILGVAKNPSELNETLRLISKTVGVRRVVNHAIMINDSRRNG